MASEGRPKHDVKAARQETAIDPLVRAFLPAPGEMEHAHVGLAGGFCRRDCDESIPSLVF